MNAVALEVLLSFFYNPDAIERLRTESLSITKREALEFLTHEKLIEDDKITERGRVFVRYVLETPLPIHVWFIEDRRSEE